MERFNRSFSTPTLRIWYDFLDVRINDRQFEAAVKHLFESDSQAFPTPREVVDLARTLVPEKQLEPASVPSYEEMGEQEREEYRAAIAKVRGMLKGLSERMSL